MGLPNLISEENLENLQLDLVRFCNQEQGKQGKRPLEYFLFSGEFPNYIDIVSEIISELNSSEEIDHIFNERITGNTRTDLFLKFVNYFKNKVALV